jgi:16S rRNA (cytosine967-C5)-methyltransferase
MSPAPAKSGAAKSGAAKSGAAKSGAAKSGPAKSGAGKPGRNAARSANLPRRTAYDVLAAVRDREAYANLLLPRLLADRQLAGRDAALATELTYGTLRGQGTYDAVLAACSDRPLDKLDPPVRTVLRLGAHQLLSTRVGAHAAVATSVDLARFVAGPRVAGYVNAVLRRVATRDLDAWLTIVAPDPLADQDGYLAVRYSHPRWIVEEYRAALGDAAAAELEQALEADNARPKVTLATFPAGRPRDEVMPPGAEPGTWSPYAFTLDSGDPSPLIESGQAAVQDEASQLAAIALARAPLEPRPSRDAISAGTGAGGAELWLDMCAGPGGKSRLLYGLAQLQAEGAPAATHRVSAEPGKPARRAALIAAEIHPHRAALVRDALSRAGHPPGDRDTGDRDTGDRDTGDRDTGDADNGRPPAGAAVVVADATVPAWPDGMFDRVLVDAPCSGLGALRRRPEARWRKSPADIPPLAQLQRDLLSEALRAVRPGGVVAYVTCSPVPAETTDVVAAVAGEGANVIVLDTADVLAEVPGVRSSRSRFAQLWPHRHGTDAIFIALLRRATQ